MILGQIPIFLALTKRYSRYQTIVFSPSCRKHLLLSSFALSVRRKISLATLSKKCPYPALFWSVFSRIRTEYGEIRSNLTRITPNTDTFHAVWDLVKFQIQVSAIKTFGWALKVFSFIYSCWNARWDWSGWASLKALSWSLLALFSIAIIFRGVCWLCFP